MGFPQHIDTISMWQSILFKRGHRSKFQIFYVFMSLKIVFIEANSADPDEMLPYQGQIQDFWKGSSKGVGVSFAEFISFFLIYPMKMK